VTVVGGDYNAPAPVPTIDPLHQLTAPPGDFTGRGAELDELLGNVRRGITISGVQGMGGVGKTVLALKLAEELKDNYPDAQFHLDLKGTSPDPLSAADAMAHVIHGFSPDLKLPEDEGRLRGLYNSALHGKRVLLLMDNAANAEQVEPLIPPAGSILLVTSRQHFTLPGLYAKDLDALPPGDARKLLLRICERIRDQADEIARLCACLPLALRLAGSALAERPDLTPAEYVRRRSDEQERLQHLEKVDASISLSEALLDEELRQRWHMLAVFPDDFDRQAAAALWELDQEQAHDALSELVRYSVLQWSDRKQRYRLHDLVRLVTDRRLGDPARTAAQHRHAAHYLGVARRADELFLQGGENLLAGLVLLDQEWPNIQAGFAWAGSRAPRDKQAARLCCDYPDAGTYCLDLRQHPRERIAWLDAALAAARQLGDRGGEGNHLGNLGVAYAALGEPRRAIECHEQALAISREIGDRRGEGQDLGNLGLAYAALGETRRAIEYYEQRLAIAREIGDRRGEGAALGNLGNAYADLGEPRRAIEYYEQALAISREIGDRRGEGNTLGNLGIAYAVLGEPRRAIEYYEQHLAIAREIGDRAGEARASWNLGAQYAKAGKLARAVELMQVCVDYEREIGHPHAEKDAARVQELRRQMNK